jgi:hypothetical protein
LNKVLTEKEFRLLYSKFNPTINKTSLWKKLLSNVMSSG